MNATLNNSGEFNDNFTFTGGVILMPIYIHSLILILSTVGLMGNALTILVLLKHEIKSFSVLLCCLFMSDSLFTATYISGAITFIMGYDTEFRRELLRTFVEFCLGVGNGCASLASIERSIAVLKAFWHRRNWKKKYSLIGVGSIIVVNIALEVLRRVDFGIKVVVYVRILEHTLRRYIPFMFITAGNILMAMGMYKSMMVHKVIAVTDRKDINNTRLIFALIMTYFICTAPGSIMVLIFDTGLRSPNQFDNQTVFMVTIILEVINASVNCFLYALVNRKYRTDLCDLICCREKKTPSKIPVGTVATACTN